MANWDDVKKSLEDSRYKWRTIRGLAKDTASLPEEIQKLLITHSDVVVKSSIPADSGEELFTTREHFRRMQSPLVKIAGSVTTSVMSSGSSSGRGKGED
ncbi:MAG: hypothetical protein A2042_01970 [Candidatus Schekmanbacteria bacterium GWA2_38_11]|uniref:Uncharacterized protein n=1 Tax=Candidatus Schekmanbacteria bacterium GWA2_38_11 TaxID=1817876 RepID=A0A1F7RN42_9BACT|nr:MAG: hypothetical protein A2042_01970 [Candidatus Schekmanbacteria bacterium GWA2_38_11]